MIDGKNGLEYDPRLNCNDILGLQMWHSGPLTFKGGFRLGGTDPVSREKIKAYPASRRIFWPYPVSRSMYIPHSILISLIVLIFTKNIRVVLLTVKINYYSYAKK